MRPCQSGGLNRLRMFLLCSSNGYEIHLRLHLEVHNTVCPTSYGDSFRGTSQRDEVRMNIPELLTCKEVMDMTGIKSRTTIWRRIQSGRFPHPIDFDGGRIRWRAQDIAAWVNSRPLRRY
ncbi:helix-turn-helix domain-containing protein [Sphingobium sp. D43FB]|uniref:helix-turn-helix transcriptional regulator n=1 Tax=Sphingobium sp. D43FB TaxID=2017595 RepID=UPI0031BAF31F